MDRKADELLNGWVSNGTAEDAGTVSRNGRTWLVAKKAEKSGDASCELLSDVGEAGCVRVALEGLEPDSADAKAYLDSFVPNDEKTVKDDYQKACEIKFDEVVADFGK